MKILRKNLQNIIKDEIEKVLKENSFSGQQLQDPISPDGQMVTPEELINDIKAGLDLCYTKLERPDEIDYELVILLGNALKRVQALTGEEYP